MARVLVATLGASPIVVSAMVAALAAHPDSPHVLIDQVLLVCPGQDRGGGYVRLGIELITEALQTIGCPVAEMPYGYADTDSYQANIAFLQALDAALTQHARDEVYVSCAGGRKSMSALAATVTQFHACVRGVYHILDRFEADPERRNLFTVPELFEMPEAVRGARMRPPVESLALIRIPHETLASADQLRQQLSAGTADSGPVDTLGQAGSFFRQIFGVEPVSDALEIRFSERAKEQFNLLWHRDRNTAQKFMDCFEQMRSPTALNGRKHGSFGATGRSYHFYKRRHTTERPFFYTEPGPIENFETRPVARVIVVGLSREQGNGQYDITAAEWLQAATSMPRATVALGDLRAAPGVLIALLGETPMVVTQTLTLLRRSHGVRVDTVVPIYPGASAGIQAGADLLKTLLTRPDLEAVRGTDLVRWEPAPISNMADVDSTAACERFARALGDTARRLRQERPDRPIHLSLTGGRKSMAAVACYAAQHAGIDNVWHSVISDPDLEQRVIGDTARAGTLGRSELAERFFLRAYESEIALFALFKVPVIPVA